MSATFERASTPARTALASGVGLLLVASLALVALPPADGSRALAVACLLAALAGALAAGFTATRVRPGDYRLTWIFLAASSLAFAATAGLALAEVRTLAALGSVVAVAGVLAIAAVACRFPSFWAFVAAVVEMAPVPVAVTAIPTVLAAGEPGGTLAWVVGLGALFAVLIVVSSRVVSLRQRRFVQAAGSLLFPSAMATLGVAGLATPLYALETTPVAPRVVLSCSLAGFVLLAGAALRRTFAHSRPPRFAAPPLNGLATFSASTLALGAMIAASFAARQVDGSVAGLLDVFALTALAAYIGRAFILRSAVQRLVQRLEGTTETLRKEQNFSSAILDAAGSLIMVVDRTGRAIRWNQACVELSGRTEAELAGPAIWDFLLPDEEVELVRERVGRVLSGELRNTGENHWIRPDGERRLLSWTNTGLVDGRGEVEFMVSVGVDVTDSRRAERDLQRTTSTLRGLVDASPLAIVATDRGDVVQVWSPAATRLTGWPAEEAIGRRLAELTIPDDLLDEYARARTRLLDGATITNLETVRRRRDGSRVDVEISASPLRDSDGAIMGVVWVETDVSARRRAAEALRQSEERFRGYFEHAPTGMVITTPAGTIVGVNPAFCRMVGYSAAELADKPFQLITHPDDVADNMESRRALLRGEQSRLEYEKRYLHKDGHIVWAQISVEPVDDGQERRLFAHVQDVTERKRVELEREEMLELKQRMLAELEAQNDRLRELDRLKDEFLALVSHELRTPLTSIRGFLSVLTDRDFVTDETERLRFLEVVERNARRLEQLVEDLLLIAQIDAGKLELDRLELDLTDVASDAVETADASARARGIEVTFERGGSCMLWGDSSRLSQVVDNLLANALKFTPEGGAVHVVVGSDGQEAYVEVADTGIGIPSDEQAQLFQRFFRATNARARAIKGTGLGLAICRAIVEAHRGWISVESEPGKGTTVTVRLPVDARQGAEDAQAA